MNDDYPPTIDDHEAMWLMEKRIKELERDLAVERRAMEIAVVWSGSWTKEEMQKLMDGAREAARKEIEA